MTLKVIPNEEKWTKTRYKNLLEQIDLVAPRFILEFGVWKGYTAVRMIKHALQYRQDVHYFGIDTFQNITVEQAAYENHTKAMAQYKETLKYLDSEIGQARHSVVMGESKKMFRKIRRNFMKNIFYTKHCDLIFIDGGHSVATILHDWLAAESIMDDKTVVIFDDYYKDITDVGAFHVIEYGVNRRLFDIEYLQPVDMFKTADGRPQPTQMVKVTRKRNLAHEPEQSHGLDESIFHNPYLQESSWDDDED